METVSHTLVDAKREVFAQHGFSGNEPFLVFSVPISDWPKHLKELSKVEFHVYMNRTKNGSTYRCDILLFKVSGDSILEWRWYPWK